MSVINTNSTIKFAVIGCGHIGKRHAEMVMRNPDCELAALCDERPREELGIEKYDVPYFPSVEALLAADIDMDVVCVCTPNGLHADHAMMVLDKNKHVVCEKPLGLSAAKCEQVISRALKVSRQVFCVMQNRYSPPSVWIKEVIDKQLMGDIFMVHLNCYWNRDDRYYTGDKASWKGTQDLDGGTLFTQFSHFIDIMYWLFGDITNIQARFEDFTHAHSTDFEDSGIVSFDFVNGGIGSINYSTAVWDSNFESSITIIGSKGTVKIGGQYMDKVEYCHIEGYEMPELEAPLPPNDYGAYKGSAANHHFIIQNVVDTLKGKTSATTNALEGLKVVDIIERIYALRKDNILNKKQKRHVRTVEE